MDREALLGTLVVAGFVLWQLVTGKISGSGSRSYAARLTNPLAYWLVIFGECIVLVVMAVSIWYDWEIGPDSYFERRRAVSVDERRGKAFELHRAGKLNEAIAVYDELLRGSDSDAELHYWRAMAHWKQQARDLALNDFRRVIELQPTNFDAHLSADRILTEQRRWDEILEMWNRYLRLVPADAAAYFERGGTNYRKGDLAAAQADAARACNLGKQEGCAWAKRLEGRVRP